MIQFSHEETEQVEDFIKKLEDIFKQEEPKANFKGMGMVNFIVRRFFGCKDPKEALNQFLDEMDKCYAFYENHFKSNKKEENTNL